MGIFKKVGQWYDDLMLYVDHREDTDHLLSYYTKQQVLFLDKKLGITFYFLTFLVAAFIVGYMFIYQKGYLQYEQAKGAVTTHVFGDAMALSSGKVASRYFSTEEITYPGLENGNVFVATRMVVHDQLRGVCEDPDVPCLTEKDCTEGGDGVCTKNGLCQENSWCDQAGKPEIYEIDSGDLQIWARSSIQFVKTDPNRVFSTETESPLPRLGYNTFTVKDLLMKCEPLPVRYEEVAELGAAVEVQFIWNCVLGGKLGAGEECNPTIKARRLDPIFNPDNIGFGFSYPEHIVEGHRVRNEVRGVRIFFKTTGVGRKFSVAATITKASMGASLFSLAQIAADLLMTKVFKLQKKYNARKYENTPDFSDYIASVEIKAANSATDAQLNEEEGRVHAKEALWMAKLNEEDI